MHQPTSPLTLPRPARLSLLLLALLILAASLPPASTGAQGQRKIVERWSGTISVSKRFHTRGTPAELLFDGQQLEQYDLRYDLAVDEDGFVNGDIFITLNKVSTAVGDGACFGTALLRCTITTSVSDSQGSQFWEGRRFTDAQNRPRIELVTEVGEGSYAATETTVCGLVAPLYLSYVCMPPEPVEWSADIPKEFIITPYQHGRSPLATPTNAHFKSPTMSWDYSGQLVGVGKEPLLDLDVELLERSRFFTQVPVANQLDANLEWNSPDGGRVSWQIAQRGEQYGPTRERKVITKTDVGRPAPGTDTVQVQARNSLNLASAPATTQITAIRWPVSAESPANVSAAKLNKVVAYRYALRFPNPPFEAEIKNVPNFVPFFGGGPLGISDTQAGGEVEILSTGEGYGKLDGKVAFEGMSQKIAGTISVKAQAVLNKDHGVEFPSGEISIALVGKLENKEPLVKLIPSLAGPVLALGKISPAAQVAINKLYVQAEIEPKFELLFKLKDNKGWPEFVSGEARPGVGIKANLVFELVPETAVASVGIGGELVQGFKVPAPHLMDTEIKLLANAKVVLGTWQFEREAAIACTYAGGAFNCQVPASLIDALGAEVAATQQLWTALDRSYTQHVDHGRWTGDENPVKAPGLNDQRLVAVVTPQADPTIAISPDSFYGARNVFLAWSHDRADRPAGSARELTLAIKSNVTGAWAAPRQLTNDDRDDWGAKLVYTPAGGLVALWQRMDTATPPDINVDPNAYLSHMQIAGSWVSQGLSGATVPQQLSSGGLSYRPQLAAIPTGAMAVWITNSGNQIGGDAANPDALMFSRYTESSASRGVWGVAAPVLPPMAGLVDYHLASNGPHAAIIFARDTDGNMGTLEDQELFVTRYVGGAWSAAQQITTNTVADESPQLALAADGSPLLVWKQAGAMVFRSGSWTAAARPIGLPEAAERSDYQLVRAPEGSLALVWQENDPAETRIGYALYDRADAAWGGITTIAPPVPATDARTTMATAIAPALVVGSNILANNRLIAAYLLADVGSATRVVGGTAMPNVQQTGLHSLHLVDHRVGANLTLTSSDVTVTPASPGPAEDVQVQVVVRNTGQLAAGGMPLNLVAGDGDGLGNPEIVTSSLLPLIRAGAAHTVTMTVKRPEQAREWGVTIPTAFTSCDGQPQPCSPLVLEVDYSDNYASIAGELSIAPLPTTYTSQGVALTARVSQAGALYSTSSTSATLRLGAPDGLLVGQMGIAFPISRTTTIESTAWISPTVLGPGSHTLYWELDPARELPERSRVDNSFAVTVNVLPDLASSAPLIGWGRAPGASAPLSMRVENGGSWASAASVVELWDGPPGAAGSRRLGRVPIPAIAAGNAVELTGTLNLAGSPAAQTGLKALYVQLDPDGTLAEVNENNNLIIAGEPTFTVSPPPQLNNSLYLPLLRR